MGGLISASVVAFVLISSMRKHFTIIFYHRFWCRRSFPRVLPAHILNALELFVLILCLMFILWYVSVRYKSINERASFVKSSAHTKVNYPTITSTSCSTCTCCSVKPSTIIFCCSWYEVYPVVFPRI